jgi:hypothetical protein
MNHTAAVRTHSHLQIFTHAVLALLASQFTLKEPARAAGPVLSEPPRTVSSTLYADGRDVQVVVTRQWRYFFDGELAVPWEGLEENASEVFRQRFMAVPVSKRSTPLTDGGVNIVFYWNNPIPPEAAAALEDLSAYLATVLHDSITVYVGIGMYVYEPGVMGLIAWDTVTHIPWADARAGMIAGMDLTDVIQNWLPEGNSIPVRFNGAGGPIDQIQLCSFPSATYRATLGTLPTEPAGAITFNSTLNWDYDPSDGLAPDAICFRSCVIRQLEWILGFVSHIGTPAVAAQDIFRFQRTDGDGDWNPDTYAEFQLTPRTLDINQEDDANLDFIVAEFPMSDGTPSLPQFFREENPRIGTGDPVLAHGETYYPDYLMPADIMVLDALGWDDAPADCNKNGVADSIDIAENPAIDCQQDGVMDACQLYRNDCNHNQRPDECDLENDCDYSGVPDECELSDNDCNSNGGLDSCDEWDLYWLLTGPASQSRCSGQSVVFSIGAPAGAAFQWYKNGNALVDGNGVSGSTTAALSINPVSIVDRGSYRCEVTQGCITTLSRSAALFVTDTALSIAQQPVAQVTICAASAQSAVFDFHVTDESGVSYRWYRDGVALDNAGRIAGAFTSQLLIAAATAADTGNYSCRATNTCGGFIGSDPSRGKLTVVGASVQGQPQATCTSAGGQARFQARVDASAGTQYFWYRNGEFLTNGTDAAGMVVSGANTRLLKLNNVPATYNGQSFQLVTFVSSPTCIGQSDLATLTVGATCGPCRFAGDLDGDLDADLKDMAIFATCLGMPATGACACANADADNATIDLADWDAMEVRMNGPS